MENNNQEIDELIKQFSKLPGLGPKSAKRIILKLITNKENMIKPLAKSLANVYKNIVRCNECGNLKTKDTLYTSCPEKGGGSALVGDKCRPIQLELLCAV